MSAPDKPDPDLEKRLSRSLLDVFIRAGFIFAMVVLCYQIFSPFVALMAWALILAVTLYPAHQKLARRLYVIRNARLDPDWAQVERSTMSIAGRAVASLIHTQGIGDLYRIYATAQRDGVDST